MPPAARITDNHTCPAHGGGPLITGELTVIIGFEPASRITDKLVCPPAPDVVVQGEPTVIIGFQPAARIGDATAHTGVIVTGCPTVIIGSSTQGNCMSSASESGSAFVTKG